jgi:hypothetical protein
VFDRPLPVKFAPRRAMRRTAVFGAALLVAVPTVGVAATPTTVAANVIPAAVAQADEICDRTNRRLMEALATVERNRSTRRLTPNVRNRTARPADVIEYTSKVAVPLLRGMVTELGRVKIPTAQAADFRSILTSYSAGLDQLVADPTLAARADPLRAPSAALRAIRFAPASGPTDKLVGFAACGSTNRARFAPTTTVAPTGPAATTPAR